MFISRTNVSTNLKESLARLDISVTLLAVRFPVTTSNPSREKSPDATVETVTSPEKVVQAAKELASCVPSMVVVPEHASEVGRQQ